MIKKVWVYTRQWEGFFLFCLLAILPPRVARLALGATGSVLPTQIGFLGMDTHMRDCHSTNGDIESIGRTPATCDRLGGQQGHCGRPEGGGGPQRSPSSPCISTHGG